MYLVCILCFSCIYRWNMSGEYSDLQFKKLTGLGECSTKQYILYMAWCYRLISCCAAWHHLLPCAVLCCFSRSDSSLCFRTMFLTAYRWCPFGLFHCHFIHSCLKLRGILRELHSPSWTNSASSCIFFLNFYPFPPLHILLFYSFIKKKKWGIIDLQ